MNNLVLEECFQVSVHDCSPNGMRTYAILRHLQDAAEHHAELLGIGVKTLQSLNFYWVLLNLRLQILAVPMLNNRILLKTWPMGVNGLLAKRAFEGYDAETKQLVFAANTDWMILDRVKHRPVSLNKGPFSIPDAQRAAHAQAPVRQRPLSQYTLLDKVNVRYSSIDVNGHVNNTEYVRWGMDALHSEERFQRKTSQIEVSFGAEVFENDRLEIMYAETAVDQVALTGVFANDGRNVFLMQVTFID